MRTKKIRACGACGKPRSPFILNNKTVCLRCDELLFDIEIECDEERTTSAKEKMVSPGATVKRTLQIVKK